ncbi:hypothetical protein PTQ19_01035 [Microbacterium esteraromaticum]|uniref:hypothetical protein n=1 Tax=Microbacterium esteraromaticum TaxID=57043 RepID=UPI001A8FC76F|nr:hypothetical protein [Microbacterium esteraromaticum]MBN8424664.1 hypothetical protein [Microbacterium esteraromaticum]WDH79056.1 hypothetical protein PTQ19_01035 [Microbacterium esteraromaticum]
MKSAPPFDQAAWVANQRSAKRRRAIWTALIITALLLALFYGGRVAWLTMMATGGDVPPASSVPLPEGAEILGDSIGCGSGGCSVTFTVRPPSGQSPEALAEEMGATPQMSVSGTFWDPRTVWVSARPAGSVLNLVVDYRSAEWVP